MCKRLTKTFPKAGNQHKEEPLRLEELGQYFGHQNLPWQVRPKSMFTNDKLLPKKFCLFSLQKILLIQIYTLGVFDIDIDPPSIQHSVQVTINV